MTGRILILGKDGQIGGALASRLGQRAIATGRAECDLLDAEFIPKLEKRLGSTPLSAVINASAFTQVDKAEGEDRPKAFRVNATAVHELAVWCRMRGLPLVHYSSDYVFDGSGNAPRREDAPTAPINAYGVSKLGGEQAIQAQGVQYLIFRTSWVYDATGKNFFTTIRRLLTEKETLNVVADQVGAPSYAAHIAAATIDALTKAQTMPAFPSGLYHLCHTGETSWHGFASAIFAHEKSANPHLKCQSVNPIPTSAYPLPATRPLNSRLDCSHVCNVLGIVMPNWEEGLAECFRALSAPAAVPATL